MNFCINSNSILCSILILIGCLIRTIYLLFSGKKKYPSLLFKGKYKLIIIFELTIESTITILSLFFSNSFEFLWEFFVWALTVGICLCLIGVSWIIFAMHGYEARYQFNRVLVPAPISILMSLVILFTGVFTQNIFVLLLGCTNFVISYIWNYKAYQLTKPKIPEYIPIQEEENY